MTLQDLIDMKKGFNDDSYNKGHNKGYNAGINDIVNKIQNELYVNFNERLKRQILGLDIFNNEDLIIK